MSVPGSGAQSELGKAADRCEEARKRAEALGLTVVTALIGLVLLVPALWFYRHDLALEAHSGHALAAVTQVHEYPGKTIVTVRLEYEFSVGGKAYTGAGQVSRYGTGESRAGDRVAVQYDVADPSANRLQDPTEKWVHAGWCYAAGAVVLLSPLAYLLRNRLS